jgi:predicted transcriptional regulator
MSVREVMEALNRRRPRAYTSVMSLLCVMTEKGLVSRRRDGRAFLYSSKARRQRTVSRMVGDLLGRAFEGSADLMVAHLLQEAQPTSEELAAIRHVPPATNIAQNNGK